MSEALRKVSTGFKLVYYGLVLVVLAVIVGIVGLAVLVGAAVGGAGGQAGGQAAAGGVIGLMLLVGGLAVIGSIVGLVGRVHCLAIPDEAGSAKPMIVTSVVLEVISLLSSVVNTADNVGGNFIPFQVKTVAGGLGMIFSVVAAILFLLFIRSAAEYVRRPRLADTAMSVLWLWVATIGCYIAGIVVVIVGVAAGAAAGGGAGRGAAGGPGAGAAGGACVGSLLMLTALVLGLVALVRYARLLTEMSRATLRFADRMEEYDEQADEGNEDDRPRRSRRDEEEDEDDRPRRSRRRDDDEDEDDRPRRSKKRDDDW
jgi:hypothetical protein